MVHTHHKIDKCLRTYDGRHEWEPDPPYDRDILKMMMGGNFSVVAKCTACGVHGAMFYYTLRDIIEGV